MKGVLEGCSLLNVMPFVNIVKLSWSGQRLPLPLRVVKRCKTRQAVSEKAVCYLMQYVEKNVGIFISHLENSCNQIVPEISGQMICQNFNQISCTIRRAGGGNYVFVCITEGTGMKGFWQLAVLGVFTGAFPSHRQHVMCGFHVKKPYGLEAPRRHSMFWYYS